MVLAGHGSRKAVSVRETIPGYTDNMSSCPQSKAALFNALQQGGITVVDVRSPNQSNIV